MSNSLLYLKEKSIKTDG